LRFHGEFCGKGKAALSIDQGKLNQFMQQAVGDLGATFHAALVVIGDKPGLYRAMAEAGPVTSSELAKRAGLAER
jgi:copper homeostasis protein CutC